MDPTLEREEVIDGLTRGLGLASQTDIELKTIKIGYYGTNTAIVALPAEIATKMGETNKIKMFCAICRIVRTKNVIRCFKCHDLGHLSYVCPVKTNGEEICRRCGERGHQMSVCNAIRKCILCTNKGTPAAEAEHIAGAANCPQFKKYCAGMSYNNRK